MKRILGIIAAVGSGVGASATAGTTAQICTSAADERRIEVAAPGEVGAACDLRYVRERGANVSIPYHANNDAAWCLRKAQELIEQLTQEGYSCGPAAAEYAALAGGEAATPRPPTSSIDSRALAPAPDAPSPIAASPDVSAPEAPVTAAAASLPNPFSAEDDLAAARAQKAEADSVAAAEAADLPPLTEEAPTQPVALADGSPVDLTAGAKPIMVRAPKPASGGAGRLVGVAPGARVSEPSLASAGPGVAAPASSPAPLLTFASRPAEEVIRGVLAAQVASWNDGDLGGFLAGYWNSPDLVVVSGQEKAVGWKEIERRYLARYRSVEEFGRLSHDDVAVTMVDAATARVTGRYRHEQAGAMSTGAFVLTMKDFDGRWRIVYDQTSPGAANLNP